MGELVTLVRYNLRFKVFSKSEWGYMIIHGLSEMVEVGKELMGMGLQVEMGNYFVPVREAVAHAENN